MRKTITHLRSVLVLIIVSVMMIVLYTSCSIIPTAETSIISSTYTSTEVYTPTVPFMPPATNTPSGFYYYVSNSGDDTNPGTMAQPFRTIQKGVDKLTAGDTLYVRGGTYNESVILRNSGTANKQIGLEAYPGENPILNGGSNLALLGDGGIQYWKIEGLTIQSKTRHTVQLGWWGETETENLDVKNNRIFGSLVVKGSYNDLEANDISGIYLDGTKYGTYAEQGNGDAGLMDIDGSNHNTYRSNNIHDFSNSNARGIWSQGYTHDDLFESNTITNIVPIDGYGQSIDVDGAATVEWNQVVRGNRIIGTNYVGIEIENTFNSVLEKNIIQNTGASGIIDINYDSDIGCSAIGAKGNPYGDSNNNGTCKDELTNNIIRQNLIITSFGWAGGYGGITNWGARGVKILGNTIYSVKGTANAGINYQAPANDSDQAVVKDNLIASPDGLAICSLDGFTIFSEDDHNLLYNGNGSMVYAIGSSCKGVNNLSSYQITFNKGIGSLQANPLFVNSINNDFHLRAESPAIDHGIDIGSTSDLDGVVIPEGAGYDIGAYEFPSTPQTFSTPAPTTSAKSPSTP
jgi:hypothetical protein